MAKILVEEEQVPRFHRRWGTSWRSTPSRRARSAARPAWCRPTAARAGV